MMNFDTSPRVPIFAVPHVLLSDYATENATRKIRVDSSVRSAGNIKLWNSYLPYDCVDTMIKLGWDRTT
jgi:hypothetical protein